MRKDLRSVVDYLINHPDDRTNKDEPIRNLYFENFYRLSKNQVENLEKVASGKTPENISNKREHLIGFIIGNNTKSTRLLQYAFETGKLYPFTDQRAQCFARLEVDNHYEILSMDSPFFKDWLSSLMWKEEGAVPNREEIASVISILRANAKFESQTHQLHNRVAWQDGKIYYDLSNRKWQVVEISAEGWKIIDRPPILFKRYAHMKPQVSPIDGGELEDFFSLINISDKDSLLLAKVILVSYLIPDIPHPLNSLSGQPGNAKTMCHALEKQLLDPSELSSLALPKGKVEFVQLLYHHYIAPFDNISHLSKEFSDLFCRAITGEGFQKRQLWTDEEDIIFKYRRCVSLNGINTVPIFPDLLDRSILLRLDSIPKKKRRKEAEIWSEFEKIRPGVLGAVFDIVSRAMKIKPTMKLANFERMADFCDWGEAISRAMGYPDFEFIRVYAENQKIQNIEALQIDLVGNTILVLMEEEGEFIGTFSDLLEKLVEIASDQKINIQRKGWPGSPQSLSRKFNEIKLNLEKEGISIKEQAFEEAKKEHLELKERKWSRTTKIIELKKNKAEPNERTENSVSCVSSLQSSLLAHSENCNDITLNGNDNSVSNQNGNDNSVSNQDCITDSISEGQISKEKRCNDRNDIFRLIPKERYEIYQKEFCAHEPPILSIEYCKIRFKGMPWAADFKELCPDYIEIPVTRNDIFIWIGPKPMRGRL